MSADSFKLQETNGGVSFGATADPWRRRPNTAVKSRATPVDAGSIVTGKVAVLNLTRSTKVNKVTIS